MKLVYLLIQEAWGSPTAMHGCPLQVKAEQEVQRAEVAAMKEDIQGQIADVAAGTTDLAKGQTVTAASLTAAHGKVNMLAEAFKTQQEHIQVATYT